MKVEILKSIDEKSVSQIGILLNKLDSKAQSPDFSRLDFLVNHSDFTLFVAYDDTDIVGMLSLTCCHTLSCSKFWIEDVIVDDLCRGKGVGRALVKAAVNHVRSLDDNSLIYLTSNPSRISARALYRSEGFEEYETGVFRMKK